MELSIIIPSKDRAKDLYELVKSIAESDFDEPTELIIVDDNSKNSLSEENLKSFNSFFSRIKVIRNQENKGAAFSRNEGAKFAEGKFLLFIDDDNILSENFIQILYNFIKSNRNVAMVGGLSFYYQNKKKINHGAWHVDLSRESIKRFSFHFQDFDFTKVLDADFIPNAFLVRTDVFQKVKFDTRFRGAYFEDTDFGLRVKRFGEIKIIPQAKIYHKEKLDRSDFFSNVQKLLNYDYNFVLFCKKYEIDRVSVFVGLLRIKIIFLYELLNRRYIKNFLVYLLSFLIDLINFYNIFISG